MNISIWKFLVSTGTSKRQIKVPGVQFQSYFTFQIKEMCPWAKYDPACKQEVGVSQVWK